MTIIKTTRLLLRPWKEEDLEPYAKLNSDPRVMKYFPSILTRKESDESARLAASHIEKYGWGKWAITLIETGEFVGRVGLEEIDFEASFAPNIELGYRLAFEHWGKGYASEGAKASLEYGFKTLSLTEIVAFTPIQNLRSQLVMERLGMHHNPKDDFDHPKLPESHPLKQHVLYRISKDHI